MGSAEGSRFKPFKFTSSPSDIDSDSDRPPPPPPKDPIYQFRRIQNQNTNANYGNAYAYGNANPNSISRSSLFLSAPESPLLSPSPSSPSGDHPGAQYATYVNMASSSSASASASASSSSPSSSQKLQGNITATTGPGQYPHYNTHNNNTSMSDLHSSASSVTNVGVSSSSASMMMMPTTNNTTTTTMKEKAFGFLKFPKRSPRSPPPSSQSQSQSQGAAGSSSSSSSLPGVMVIGNPQDDPADIPPPPQEDEGISLPWNFQHNIHVDEGYIGLPPSWSTSLSSAGFTDDEIAAIHARRLAGVRSPQDMRYLYSDRPQSPAVAVGFPRFPGGQQQQGQTTVPILTHPTPRTTSLPRLVPVQGVQGQVGSSSASSSSSLSVSTSPTVLVPPPSNVFSPPPPNISPINPNPNASGSNTRPRVPPPKRKPPSPYTVDPPSAPVPAAPAPALGFNRDRSRERSRDRGRGHKPNQTSVSTVGQYSSDSHASSSSSQDKDHDAPRRQRQRQRDQNDDTQDLYQADEDTNGDADLTTRTNFTNMSTSEAYNYNPPTIKIPVPVPPLPSMNMNGKQTPVKVKGHPYANPDNAMDDDGASGSGASGSGSEYEDEEDGGGSDGMTNGKGKGKASSPLAGGGQAKFRVVNGASSSSSSAQLQSAAGSSSAQPSVTTILPSKPPEKKSIWGTKIVPNADASSSSLGNLNMVHGRGQSTSDLGVHGHGYSQSQSNGYVASNLGGSGKGGLGLGGLNGAASASSPALGFVGGSSSSGHGHSRKESEKDGGKYEYESQWKTTPTTTLTFAQASAAAAAAAGAGLAHAVRQQGGSLVDAVRSRIKGKERESGGEGDGKGRKKGKKGRSRSRSGSRSREGAAGGGGVDSDEEFVSMPVDSPPSIGGGGAPTRTPVWEMYTRPRAGTDASERSAKVYGQTPASLSASNLMSQTQTQTQTPTPPTVTRKSSLKSQGSQGSLRSRLGRMVKGNKNESSTSLNRQRSGGSLRSQGHSSSGHGHSQSQSYSTLRNGSATSLDSIPETQRSQADKDVPPLPDDAKEVARSPSVRRDIPKKAGALPPRLSLHQGTGSTDLSSWSEALLSGGLGLSFGISEEKEKEKEPPTVTTATVTARPWDQKPQRLAQPAPLPLPPPNPLQARKLPPSKLPPSRPIPTVLPLQRSRSGSKSSSSPSPSGLQNNNLNNLLSPPPTANVLSPGSSAGPDSGQLWGEIERMMDPGMMSNIPGLHLSAALPPGAQSVLRSAGLGPAPKLTRIQEPKPEGTSTVADLVGALSPVQAEDVDAIRQRLSDDEDDIQDDDDDDDIPLAKRYPKENQGTDPALLTVSHDLPSDRDRDLTNNRDSSRSSSSTLTLTAGSFAPATIVRNASIARRAGAYVVDNIKPLPIPQSKPQPQFATRAPPSPLSSHFGGGGSGSGNGSISSEESGGTRVTAATSVTSSSHSTSHSLSSTTESTVSSSDDLKEDEQDCYRGLPPPPMSAASLGGRSVVESDIGSPLLYYLDGTQTPSTSNSAAFRPSPMADSIMTFQGGPGSKLAGQAGYGDLGYGYEYRDDEDDEEEFAGYPDEETMEAQRLAAAAASGAPATAQNTIARPTIVISGTSGTSTTNSNPTSNTNTAPLSAGTSPSPNTAGIITSPSPILERYPGWLSSIVAPLSAFIDESILDPRKHYLDLTEIAEGESGSVFRARVNPDSIEGTGKETLSMGLSPLVRARDVDEMNKGGEVWVAIKSVAIVPSGSPKLDDLKHELTLMRGGASSSSSLGATYAPWAHENILTMDAVYVDLVEDSLWIRMELMERSLADIISLVSDGLQLQERVMARFTSDVLCALDFLQAKGVAHRDVRSDNLLIDRKGVLKLADFSNAVQVTPGNSMRSDNVGVVFWQAPEVRKPPYDALKVDVWSLGATVWEMAQQDPPFADTQQLADSWPPLRQPELYSPAFHEFLRMCSEQPPERRKSAAELMKSSFIVHKACGRHVVVLLLQQGMAIEKKIQEDLVAASGR